MRSVNKVILIGNLTRDPELRETTGGQPVATFSIATNRVWNDSTGQRQEATDFHDLVAWGKLAEICDQYLGKGSAVYVEGRLHTRRWEAPDNTKRHKTEVVVQELNILQRKNDTGPVTDKSEDGTTSSPLIESDPLDLDSSDLPSQELSDISNS